MRDLLSLLTSPMLILRFLNRLWRVVLNIAHRFTSVRLLQYIFALCNLAAKKWKPDCFENLLSIFPYKPQCSKTHGFSYEKVALSSDEGSEYPAAEISSRSEVVVSHYIHGESAGIRTSTSPTSAGDNCHPLSRPERDNLSTLPASGANDNPNSSMPRNIGNVHRISPYRRSFQDLFMLCLTLGRDEYIRHSLRATQRDGVTDLEKWKVFCDDFKDNVDNTNLLCTLLVTSNIAFLAIKDVDDSGTSSYRQIFCYVSLLNALVSILMGMTLRKPRLLLYGSWYRMFPLFSFPIVFCQYSVIQLLVAIITNTWQAGPGFFYLACFVPQILIFMVCYWWYTIPHAKM